MDVKIGNTNKTQFRLKDRLSFPDDVVGNLPTIRMLGNKYLLLENHGGVLELCEKQVRVFTDIGILRICGDLLWIDTIDAESLVCKGEVTKLEYES